MSDTVITACGIVPVPVNLYTISEDDITAHLQQRILNVPIHCSYDRWPGAYGNSYGAMRLGIYTKYIAASSNASESFVARKIREDGNGYLIKQEILDKLKPFMYPETLDNVLGDPVSIENLIKMGIDLDHLKEIIRFKTLTPAFDEKTNEPMWICYLRADKILEKAMLINPLTGETSGKLEILALTGGYNPAKNTREPLRWFVKESINPTNNGRKVDLDTIFANAGR